ncbi:MAG: hypothetical protein R2784_04200 [Saprospiraceae bacterium]
MILPAIAGRLVTDRSDLTVNPITSHTYNQPNTFTVGLELESSFENCNVFVQGVDLIETSPQPNPRFTTDPSPPTACEAPFTVTFTNNTNGTNLNYNWDFGNGENL